LEPADESQFVQWLLDCQDAFAAQTRDSAGVVAQQINNIRNRYRQSVGEPLRFFDTDTGVPSPSWWKDFFQRHPQLSFRYPSRHSATQLRAANPAALRLYITRMGSKLHGIPVSNILNIDELDLHQTQVSQRVIGRRGVKQVDAMKASGYGDHVTLVSCVAGDGTSYPSCFIFKQLSPPNPILAEGSPRGTMLASTGIHNIPNDLSRLRPVFSIWLDDRRPLAGIPRSSAQDSAQVECALRTPC
jgi:hypothetical protein